MMTMHEQNMNQIEPFIVLCDSLHLPLYKVSARFPVFCIDDRRLAGVTPPSHSLSLSPGDLKKL